MLPGSGKGIIRARPAFLLLNYVSPGMLRLGQYPDSRIRAWVIYLEAATSGWPF